MGWTPSIDRIAREGMLFTDHYGQPSCTAGRAAFIMGQLPIRTGPSEKSARHEIFYYDETDLMAVRVDGWKLHIGVKHHGSWFDEKSYPSVPYVMNLLMDPMEKMTPDSEEWSHIARKFAGQKLWAPTAATPFIAAHLKSLIDYPPSQGADTLSMKKAIEGVMKKMESPHGSSN